MEKEPPIQPDLEKEFQTLICCKIPAAAGILQHQKITKKLTALQSVSIANLTTVIQL